MNQELTSIPSNLHLIADNPNEFMLLCVMMRVRGDSKSVIISLSILQRMMQLSRQTIVNTIKALLSKGYIAYKKGDSSHLPNEYIINMDKIYSDIDSAEEESNDRMILIDGVYTVVNKDGEILT